MEALPIEWIAMALHVCAEIACIPVLPGCYRTIYLLHTSCTGVVCVQDRSLIRSLTTGPSQALSVLVQGIGLGGSAAMCK